MKMNILIAVFIGFVVGTIFGIYVERTTTWHDQEEWMQISQEACDLRIKTLKATCKK